ncbi:condensin-2 complex subunit G2, putative, partial [Hepatocystis sp. ex Piliocolobus tephrosceles]
MLLFLYILALIRIMQSLFGDLLKYFKTCKSQDYVELWTAAQKTLEEHITLDKFDYEEEPATLFFIEENDRQYVLTFVNFVLIYMQYLTNLEKKTKSNILDLDFQIFFERLTEIVYMVTNKEVRLLFGKCLLCFCELNIKEDEFITNVKVNILIFLLWKSCSTEGRAADISKLNKYKEFCHFVKWGDTDRQTKAFYALCSYSLNVTKFLNNADGKSFLSYVWSQNETIASHLIYKVLKRSSHVSYEKVEHYSQIIYATWKNCTGPMQNIMEGQVEMFAHAALKSPLKIASRFRNMLNTFHQNKG